MSQLRLEYTTLNVSSEYSARVGLDYSKVKFAFVEALGGLDAYSMLLDYISPDIEIYEELIGKKL